MIPKKKKMDIVDEQLSTVSQTFMALTVGCARCHDHKFDPIPTWDYYAMAGIFKSTKTMEHLRVVAPVALHEFKPKGYEQALAKYNAHRKQLLDDRDAFWRQVAQSAWLADKVPSAPANEAAPFQLPKQADKYVPKEHRKEWKRLKSAIADHESTTPQKIKVMAPTDGDIEDLPISLRGNYLTPGQVAKRQFLRIVEGEQPRPIQSNQSGRLELAHWLASEDHPLTARVIVNRIWRWRFGRGIVSTTDNFGRLGERPSHPELLDWMAVKFIEDGWSIKKLHKRMLLSATYQMSSQYDARAAQADPENRLWWRFPRRRLEAEAIRDSLLHVSDYLDLAMGGSLMPPQGPKIRDGAQRRKRRNTTIRVGLCINRSIEARSMMCSRHSIFPIPATANGDRQHSTVAPQALLMMNSELVTSAAKQNGRKALG